MRMQENQSLLEAQLFAGEEKLVVSASLSFSLCALFPDSLEQVFPAETQFFPRAL